MMSDSNEHDASTCVKLMKMIEVFNSCQIGFEKLGSVVQ